MYKAAEIIVEREYSALYGLNIPPRHQTSQTMSDKIPHSSPDVADKVTYELRVLRHAYSKLVELDLDMRNVSPGERHAARWNGNFYRRSPGRVYLD